jgi:DNA-binding NarL/FixJ family response regulator
MQQVLRYSKFLMWPSLVLVIGLLFLQWLFYKLLLIDTQTELYSGIIAILFLGLGYFIALQLKGNKSPQELLSESNTELSKFPITDVLSVREIEVLQLMAKGLSNQQIADRLFVSLSTVKTHCSSIYVKLDVKRRTGAVEKARTLGLLV